MKIHTKTLLILLFCLTIYHCLNQDLDQLITFTQSFPTQFHQKNPFPHQMSKIARDTKNTTEKSDYPFFNIKYEYTGKWTSTTPKMFNQYENQQGDLYLRFLVSHYKDTTLDRLYLKLLDGDYVDQFYTKTMLNITS